MDNRWPHLVELDRAPGLDTADRARLKRACTRVKTRTDFDVLFHKPCGTLHFFLGSADCGAALPADMVRINGMDGLPKIHKFNDTWVDEVSRFLQRGRMSRAEKDRETAYRIRSVESDKKSEEDRTFGEREKIVAENIKHIENRRGMSSRFRPTAVVNGLKGAVK